MNWKMIASGIVATACLDLWQIGLRAATGWPASNWGMVGRWFGHLPSGRVYHRAIADAAPVANEVALGWIGHYATGIVYGVVYVGLMRGLGIEPTILNGLIFGMISTVVPWFFFQPAMGAGVMGANTPNPARASLQSFLSHTAFGFGLGLGAIVV